ncbi:Aste57867_11333 [Aphanomyces stellatus]|uniref:Aste57867_11333 protein n=1 Tax=Aphanomyces stellatus TaxID=120398 RepID=A0A485KSN8_9STRA|nr:hypothetical protein As57867_011291 [Aphanomyces stellatus]VFT88195.1 Aste57867_11333 [Aphanomyces stellatus]
MGFFDVPFHPHPAILALHFFVAPLLAVFIRPDPRWSYVDALVCRYLLVFTQLPTPLVRAAFAAAAFAQRLVYRPYQIVDTPTVKGLWYGDKSIPLSASVVVLFLHGGGFVSGSADCMALTAIAPIIEALERQGVAAKVFSVDYGLSPEHVFPRAIDQMMEAYRWLLDQGISPDKIVLAGDSAGGNAVVSILQRSLIEKLPMPVCAVLSSPWLNLSPEAASYSTTLDIGNKQTLVEWGEMYLGGKMELLAAASPALHRVDGLPPLLIVYGLNEGLLDDMTLFITKAKRANVHVSEHVHPYMYHNFAFMPLEAAAEAHAAMAKFISQHVVSKTLPAPTTGIALSF